MSKLRVDGARALLALASAFAAGCAIKDSAFLGPPNAEPSGPTDVTSPVIQFINPAPTVKDPLNINLFRFSVTDLIGSNNAPASGVDYKSVAAIISGQTLQLTRSGNVFTGSLTGVGDGSTTITVQAADSSKNAASANQTFIKLTTPPTLKLSAISPLTQTSSAPSVQLSFSGSVTSQYVGTAVGGVYKLGPDGTCATSTVLWPSGTAGGQVFPNIFDYSATIKTSGAFSQTYTVYNGVPAGGTPATGTYCVVVSVTDVAVDSIGQPKPNTATATIPLSVGWTSPFATGSIAGHVTASGTPVAGAVVSAAGHTAPTASDGSYRIDGLNPGTVGVAVSNLPSNVACSPITQQATVVAGQVTTVDYNCTKLSSLAVSGSYRNLTTSSEVCVTVTGTPGASLTGTVTGPGVVGNGTFSGVLDASGYALFRVGVNQFGTYTIGVSSGSQARTASVNVTSAAGTCPAP
jgi:Carboxypeptidase regulatory-like domain